VSNQVAEDVQASAEIAERLRYAETAGRRQGHREAADYLERVAAEWSGTEDGTKIVRALRLEASNIRLMYLEDCTQARDPER